MTDLIIVGAGGFGRETLMMIEEINASEPKWNVLGFIDDNLCALDGINCEKHILGKIADWEIKEGVFFVLSIAEPHTKKVIAELLKSRGAKFATLIHPTSRLGKNTTIGEGVILAARTDVTTNIKLGNFVFLNVASQVGHDCIIGDYCTLFPNSSVAGGSVLGDGVTVGTSAATYPGVKVGEYATIGMNSAVIRNVKPNTTVMGVPAKRIV